MVAARTVATVAGAATAFLWATALTGAGRGMLGALVAAAATVAVALRRARWLAAGAFFVLAAVAAAFAVALVALAGAGPSTEPTISADVIWLLVGTAVAATAGMASLRR